MKRKTVKSAKHERVRDVLEVRAEQADEQFQASLRRARSEMNAGRFFTLAELESALAMKRGATRR